MGATGGVSERSKSEAEGGVFTAKVFLSALTALRSHCR